MNMQKPESGTKDRIVQTATELFASGSYSTVSMSEIASKLNLSKPAIYHHFSSKKTLYIAILEKSFVPLKRALIELGRNNVSVKTKLEHSIELYLNYCLKKKNIVQTVMHNMPKLDSEIIATLKQMREEIMNKFTMMLRKCGNRTDTSLQALFLLGMVNSFVMSQLFEPTENWSARQISRKIVALLTK